jgi:gliding motility-associated-like protein
MNFFKVLTLSISLFLFSNYSFSQCFEIESILVDACDNTTDEAYNEMFRMRIGGTALNTSTLNVNWPAQTWLGLVQNATTASKVTQLNADILAAGGCGQILEPTGGVLPANSTVIVVTSPNLDTTLNSFGALTSNIYMLFQNTPANPNAGHFGNYNATPATRTLTVTFGGGCSDSVTYQRANLVNIFGAVGGSISDLNGSTVNFTASGTASYVNNGCTAPIPPFTVEAGTTPIAACPGQIINLTGTAQGQTSVTWTAASGSFSNPNNLTTSYTVPLSTTSGSSITLTLSATNSCTATITDNIIINIGGPSLTLASGSNTQSVCLGASISTITYTFGGGATGVNVSGLPAGVSSIISGNNVIISGTPTTTIGSPFNYSITTTGGSCGNVTTNGTITVSNSGSLNLFCDTGNSTPTSLAFDFSNVGQSSFTYSYTIDGGTPITGTHFAPSNFTVTGLTPGQTVIFTLTANGVSCVPSQTVNCSTSCPTPTLTLTSATGTNTQTTCINTNINPITYTFGNGATGVTVTGLPAGVIHTVSGNTVTISGAPTSTIGSPFSYSITTVGGSCGNATRNGTLTINASPTLVLNSTAATTNQSICVNTSINPISYTFGGSATGINVSGLPTGVSSIVSGNTVTISGTPATTIGSPFNYTVTTLGGSCGTTSLSGTITVNPSVSLVLNSSASTTNQIVCTNTNINTISYTFGNGATGVTVTGLPTGVSHTVSGNTITISGIPTSTTGSPFSYSVSTIGGSCGTATLGGTITVNSNPTLVLISSVASTNQSICVNTSINPISYTFGGSATGINVSGLPTGVSSIVSGNTVTISGTPATTTGSPFNYTVTTLGGSCGTTSLSGTITVNPSVSLVLNSSASTTNQIVCTNTNINTISYTFGNGATGVTVTGLPTGVSHTVSGNTITISGIPTSTTGSPFSYSVSTIGGSCGTATLGGTITVNSNPTLVLISSVASTNQSICINTSINPISYTFGGSATGINVTGLPTGVNSIVSGNTVTISGTPTTTTGSPFNYTVTTSGGSCGTTSLSGTITVNPSVTLALTSAISTTNQIVCTNTTIIPINYTIGNGATGYTITGLPTGINHTISGNVVTISGIPTGIIGTPYTYTITTNGGCSSQNSSGILTLTNGTIPVFTQVLPICAGATTSPLPTTSNNGITGTWSPAFNNTTTDTYTFTPNSGQCTSNTQMTIQITPSPTITNVAFSANICSGSPTDIVITSDVLNTTYSWSATISNITGTYVTSGDETNINQIATLTDSENIGTITMVIIPRANGCDGIPSNPITITVNPNPVIESVTVADSSVCSATNATNNVHVDIVGNISGITYTWTAITNGVNVVGGVTSGTITTTSTTAAIDLQVITSNLLVAGTIYFEVSAVRNGCPGNTLQSGVVTVSPNPGLPISSPIKTICSGNNSDLIVDVSPLIAETELTWEVLTVVNVSGANPGTGIAPVTINDALTATTYAQGYVIYRVRSSLGECRGGYTDYRVNVNPAPLPVLTDGNICITVNGEVYQTYTLNTGLNDADYDFEWFDTNGVIIPGATSSTLVVDEAGTYSVIATNWLTGCSSDPLLASATAIVTETMPATSMTIIQSEYFSNNATITVNVTGGSGTLMYSLDEGPLQSSNVYTGVSAGEHLVTVVDTEECTFMTQIVTIIDYPNYFTPNGDGINDTWNISGLNQPDAMLYIFDRYGKLLKQLSATDESDGWDGTYNQELLPSTDYWFSLDYTENGVAKQFKAHFTMKR